MLVNPVCILNIGLVHFLCHMRGQGRQNQIFGKRQGRDSLPNSHKKIVFDRDFVISLWKSLQGKISYHCS